MKRRSRLAVALSALLLSGIAAAQPAPMTLEQASARKPGDFSPLHAGAQVQVRGVVSTPPFSFPVYTLLAIQWGSEGIVLKAAAGDTRLDGFRPGDEIGVTGEVANLAGAVVILPSQVTLLSRTAPPAPVEITARELLSFRYMGVLVHAEGKVLEIGETSAGAQLIIQTSAGSYKFFIPHGPGRPMPGFSGYSVGDKVSATGVAFQYCQVPPYNRWFELLVRDASDIVRTERTWFVPPIAVAVTVGLLLLTGLLLWNRERRMRTQRERLRETYQLGEEILGASAAESVLKRLSEVLPNILQVSRVHLYVYNRASKALDTVTRDGSSGASISLAAPPGGTQAGAAACFHYRTLLMIPDIDRSPFPLADAAGERRPKSLLFVPMLAQNEVIGVLELDQDDRVREFTADEQALAQHLGNQIGVALRLLDQRSVQEQLFRTEKLAAVGRLISGVVNELQAPLASISELASMAVDKSHASPARHELAAIAAEAQKASGIVARLVSFAAAEQGEARPVDINALLRSLMEFRERDWKASGIRVTDLTSREPLLVLGSQGQLEQVFLNLLVHAEQSLADSPQKSITVRTVILAKRLLAEIAFTAPPELRKAEETASVLSVTRSVVAGHGGEVRLIDKANADPRFEVELPAIARERGSMIAPSAGAGGDSSRRMTALVIEPDEAAQRQLLAILSARGYRVVPVDNSDTGQELAQRLRFDAAFCSVHAPGLNWVELSERLQSRVGGFILLSDGYDPELSDDFEGEGRFVVPKPLQEKEVDRVLQAVELAFSVKAGAKV